MDTVAGETFRLSHVLDCLDFSDFGDTDDFFLSTFNAFLEEEEGALVFFLSYGIWTFGKDDEGGFKSLLLPDFMEDGAFC